MVSQINSRAPHSTPDIQSSAFDVVLLSDLDGLECADVRIVGNFKIFLFSKMKLLVHVHQFLSFVRILNSADLLGPKFKIQKLLFNHGLYLLVLLLSVILHFPLPDEKLVVDQVLPPASYVKGVLYPIVEEIFVKVHQYFFLDG